MNTPILTTKLYVPPPRPNLVRRPRLLKRLNAGLRQPGGFGRKLTLISAPAGFGKTTLISNWVDDCRFQINDVRVDAVESQSVNQQSKIVNQIAWLSLDAGDNDLTRFLTYFIAALQTVAPQLGEGALDLLQSPQPPPVESLLTALLNEIAAVPDSFCPHSR